MIDVQIEQPLTFAQAARSGLIPRRRGDRPVAPSTLYRWSKQGIRGVKLETLRAGGGLVTSAEALQRFFERLSQPAAEITRTSSRRDRADRQAAEELERMGV